MAHVIATITNISNTQTYELPDPLGGLRSDGGREIGPNTMVNIHIDTQGTRPYDWYEKPRFLEALEELQRNSDITVSISPSDNEETVTDLEAQLEAAIAQAQTAVTRQGVATISSGTTSTTVMFSEDMPSDDYEVFLTAKEAKGSATDLFVQDSNIQAGQFDIEVDSDPTKDVDVAYLVRSNS